jgi:exodeoxyribonuclease-3
VKFATWNINGIDKRLALLTRWLDAAAPDVVALQEIKCTDAAFPFDVLARHGYRALVVGQRPWNGVALLARGVEPVRIRRALPGDPGDREARYLEAAIDGVIVASIYLPNGNPQPGPKFDRKLAWFERLIDHAQSLADTGLPVVLLGDFNVVPTDADIYRSKTNSNRDNALLQPAVRDCYRRLLAQGWTDALRATHADRRIYTFWSYLRDGWTRDAGWRIDHLLVSGALATSLTAAGVDREQRALDGASDHAPVWMEITRRTKTVARR